MKTALLLAVSLVAARAQAVWPCETTLAIDHQLRNPALTDPQIAFADRWAAFHQLLSQYPEDVFVHRRYQDWLRNALVLQERQVAEYREAWRKDPSSVQNGYLYARMLLRRDYEQAFAIVSQLAEKHPGCPWLHLALAEMRASRSMAKLQDPAEGRRQLDTYLGQCPASLDPSALSLIQQLGDAGLLEKTAARLRSQLESRDDAPAVAAWPQLWQLESRLRPAAEQESVRQRERQDLARLRARKPAGMLEWYDVLEQGYAAVDDEAGQNWADAQLLRDLGNSAAAFDLVAAQWWKAHTSPSGRPVGPDEARFRDLLLATGDWVKRWPDHPGAWQNRFRAVAGLKDTPAATVNEVATKFLEMADRSPDAIGGTVPPPLDVARLLVDRGVGLDRVPALIRQMDQQLAATYETDRHIQYGAWANPAYLELYRWNTRWEGMKVLFNLYSRTNRTDNALEVLESLRQSVASVDPADRLSQAAGWPMVVDLAVAAGRLETARAALARLEAFRVANRPKPETVPDSIQRMVSAETPFWEGAAHLAEAEGRKLDAVSFYLAANSPADREQAHRLWTSLGGTASGWDATLDRAAAQSVSQTAAILSTRDTPLPDFLLEDVAGKKVRLADLKGTTIFFLNIWATWCGPCREELPQIEQLNRSLQGRGDIAVVTLNADENPGLVKPFLERAGYSFPALLGSDYVWKALQVTSIPQNWIVDAAGVVRMDLDSLDRATLAAQVLPLLEKLPKRP